MFRQALSTSSRALRSAAPKTPAYKPFVLPAQSRTVARASALRTAQPAVARWYSNNTKEATAEQTKEETTKDEKAESDPVAELKKALEAKEAEAKELKDSLLRTVADFRNLQDRTAREVKSGREFAIQKFAKDLLEHVDNLDRALSQDPSNLHEGVKMISNGLMNTLQRHGVERVHPEGEKFDPNEHEATFMVPQPDKEDNSVFQVQQTGFKLNGRVLRAAKVGVVKNK